MLMTKGNFQAYKIQTACTHKMDSITIEMKRKVVEDDVIRQIFIETNPVGTLSMKDIKTNHRHSLWKKISQEECHKSKK